MREEEEEEKEEGKERDHTGEIEETFLSISLTIKGTIYRGKVKREQERKARRGKVRFIDPTEHFLDLLEAENKMALRKYLYEIEEREQERIYKMWLTNSIYIKYIADYILEE